MGFLTTPSTEKELPASAEKGLSGLALMRQLLALGEIPEVLRVGDAVPFSSPDAPEVTQLLAGYQMWTGNFHTARHLIDLRLHCGLPDSLALQVRRWQIQHNFLAAVQKEEPVRPDWSAEPFLPDWMRWPKMLQQYALHTPEGMCALKEIAQMPAFQARLFTDPTMRRLWESLRPLMDRSSALANQVRDVLLVLLKLPNPTVFRFGLGNFRDLHPRFTAIFRLDLLRDEVVLNAAAVHRHPEVHGEFLQWFWEQAGATRQLLEKLEARREVILRDSLHELIVALTESGLANTTHNFLLQLADLSLPHFQEASRDHRLRHLREFWQWAQDLETQHPGGLSALHRLRQLSGETERITEILDAFPESFRENPLVRLIEVKLVLVEDPARGLAKLEGLDMAFDPLIALLRTYFLFKLGRQEEALSELWSAPPTLILIPYATSLLPHLKACGEEYPLLSLFAKYPRVEKTDLLPKPGTYAIYLTRHAWDSEAREPHTPALFYYRVAVEQSAGTALRRAREWVRHVLLMLGAVAEPTEAHLRFWQKTLGLQVIVVPDLRPHFSMADQLARLIPEVLRELAETSAEEDEEAEEEETSPDDLRT